MATRPKCFGPIKVNWGPETRQDGKEDEKLAVLFGFDLIEISKDKPDTAAPNEYDFFFLARERIEANNAELYFWFPFPSQPLPMDADFNDPFRARMYLRWQRHYISRSLRVRNPDDPRSFGWDEDRTRKLFPPSAEGDFNDVFRACLDRAEKGDFALEDISIKELPIEGAPSHHQHFRAILNGTIEQGEIFHIFFKAQEAYASPGGKPCSGSAPLFFYNKRLEEESPYDLIEHPFAKASLVPCVLLHVDLFFPVRLAEFTPDVFARYQAAPYQPETYLSPTGRPFQDGRWFAIFNAHLGDEHLGVRSQTFHAEWTLPDCRENQESQEIQKMSPKNKAIGDIKIGSFVGNFVGNVDSSQIEQSLQATIQKENFASLRDFLKTLGLDDADIDDLEDAVTSDPPIAQPGSFGKRVSEWIGKMVSKSAGGLWDIGVAVAGELLAKAISSYYGF